MKTLAPPPTGKVYATSEGGDINRASGDEWELACPPGYEFEGRPGVASCSDKCELMVKHSLVCRAAACTWAASNLLALRGVEYSPEVGERVGVGESMTLECSDGYELGKHKMPDRPPPVLVLAGLESLGPVKVYASATFPPPPAGQAVSYRLKGEFRGITLDLPAGAWPTDLAVGPSIAIFEMPASSRRGAAVAGLGVNLGPDGTVFSQPVTMSAPVNSDFDLGNRLLRIHRYNPATDAAAASWTPLDFPAGYVVPSPPTVINALTSSFSAYFVLALDPPSDNSDSDSDPLDALEPGSFANETWNVTNSTTTNSTASRTILGLEQNLFIAVVAGGGGGVLVCAAIAGWLIWRRRKGGAKGSCTSVGGKSCSCTCFKGLACAASCGALLCGCLRCVCCKGLCQRSAPAERELLIDEDGTVVEADLVVPESSKKDE